MGNRFSFASSPRANGVRREHGIKDFLGMIVPASWWMAARIASLFSRLHQFHSIGVAKPMSASVVASQRPHKREDNCRFLAAGL